MTATVLERNSRVDVSPDSGFYLTLHLPPGETVSAPRWRRRLADLVRIQSYSLGEDEVPMSPQAVQRLAKALSWLEENGVNTDRFRIFPTPEGDVEAAIRNDGFVLTVRVPPEGPVEYRGTDLNGAGSFWLGAPSARLALIALLRRIAA